MDFDILIPVSTEDAYFIKRSLPYILKNIVGYNKVYIISRKKNLSIVKKLIRDIPSCCFIDEDELISGLSYSEVDRYIHSKYPQGMKSGWYFQQFIKLGFALSKYAKDFYLSWDADSIPLKKLSFFDGRNPILTRKTEYNQSYFDTIKTLLGLDKSVDYSFIAEHMLFKTSIVKELIQEIENSNVSGSWWVEKIINSTNYKECGIREMFSEFETYGTYCVNKYPGLYVTRTLNTFRFGGLICGRFPNRKLLDCLGYDFHIVSFELYTTPLFPRSVLHKLYLQYIRLMVLLHKSILN